MGYFYLKIAPIELGNKGLFFGDFFHKCEMGLSNL